MKYTGFLYKFVQNGSTKKSAISFKQRIVNSLFGKYLLATNTITCGVLMVAGDCMSQEIEYRNAKQEKRFDFTRSGN